MRLAIILPVGLLLVTSSMPPASQSPSTMRSLVDAGPIRFEPYRSDANPAIDFLARGPGTLAFLSATKIIVALPVPPDDKRTADSARDTASAPGHYSMTLVGATASAVAEGEEPLPGHSNYFLGNDPTRWRRNVAHYGRVRYREVYPGVDLVFRGTDHLEYDLVVWPESDPGAIRLGFEGPETLRISEAGDLQLDFPHAQVVHEAPRAYQEVDGQRIAVTARFRLVEQGVVGFDVGPYHRGIALIIDPIILVYSTFVGGTGWETPTRVAVDDAGMAYITGRTNSTDFPTSTGVQQGGWPGGLESAYVVKIDPAVSGANSLIYATYLGSSDRDVGEGIAVDGLGRAFVTGVTSGGDFPTTSNAFKPSFAAQVPDDHDAFIAVLSSSGDQLIYGSFWGGDRHDDGRDIVLHGPDVIYLTGNTDGGTFPTTPGACCTSGGANSIFLSVLEWTTGTLRYSTMLAGGGLNYARALAVDNSGRAYVAGIARSNNFPTTANAFMPTASSGTGSAYGSLGSFLSVFDPSLTGVASLVYSTYLGAGDAEDVAVDDFGNAYVVGTTGSPDFPTTAGAFDTTCEDAILDTGDGVINFGCIGDAFVMKIDPGQWGSLSLRYATRLGGGWGERGLGIAVDDRGGAYVTGSTNSPDFPQRHPLEGTTGRTDIAEGDAFVTKIAPAGNRLVFSTRLGGLVGPTNSFDEGTGIALDGGGNVCVTGRTNATDFPFRRGFDATHNGADDAFFVKLRYDACAELSTRIEDKPFEWEELPSREICLQWDTNPDGLFEGFPRRCPPMGCPECSPALSRGGQIGAPPDFLATTYRSAAPVFGMAPPRITADDRYSVSAWRAVERQLNAAKTGRFFTSSLKKEAMAAVAGASQSPESDRMARGLLRQSLNAMELDWRTPELRAHKMSTGKGAVDLQGIARLAPPKAMSDGQLSLGMTPGMPALPQGYRPGWPLATFRFEYDGSLPKDHSMDVEFYAGWIGFDQPGEIRVLQWDGSGFNDVTEGVKYADGTIRARVDMLHDYVLVRAIPCFRWRLLQMQ